MGFAHASTTHAHTSLPNNGVRAGLHPDIEQLDAWHGELKLWRSTRRSTQAVCWPRSAVSSNISSQKFCVHHARTSPASTSIGTSLPPAGRWPSASKNWGATRM